MLRKKLLSLGLAGVMVASTGVTAFAQNQTVNGNESDTLNANAKITGSVKDAQGTAPAGKLEVELPTAMAFSVDQDGNFNGATYTIKNNSSVGVDVSISQFNEADKKGGITLVPMTETEANLAAMDRSNVKLYLEGDNIVDLAATVNPSQILTSIDASTTKSVHLRGAAGKAIDAANNAVDQKGATEEFNLVFQIKKQP